MLRKWKANLKLIIFLEMVELKETTTTEEFGLGRMLFQEYSEEIQVDLCFQNFEEELENIESQYARPDGILCLALLQDGRPVACFGLRKWDKASCELKRMYVKREFRGRGLGVQLLETSIRYAKDLGYRKMLLDTLPSMTQAIRLYERFGFREIQSYRHNPVKGAMYYGRRLNP